MPMTEMPSFDLSELRLARSTEAGARARGGSPWLALAKLSKEEGDVTSHNSPLSAG